MRYFVFLCCCLSFWACEKTSSNSSTQAETQNVDTVSASDNLPLDLQGHRGARGLLPENSLPAMRRAIELGVTTLEMDIVITADSVVVLSHEPFMSHEICLDPSGEPITKDNELEHNIFKMTYEEVQQYDCGSRVHERFPLQQKVAVTKPKLAEVIDMAERMADSLNIPPMLYNIEIKRRPERDGEFHPDADTYAQLLLEVVSEKAIANRTTIQSFDVDALEASKYHFPHVSTAYLIESNPDFRANLELLSFSPEIYSPYFELVTPELIAFAHDHDMQVIPWTVNEVEDMEKLIKMGVDGLISDYPDRMQELQ